jgi:serine O-acetyltransferase
MSASSPIKMTGSVKQMDPIWHAIRAEADEAVRKEPLLATFLYTTILNHQSLEEAVIHRISQRLDHPDVESELLRQTFTAMVEATPSWSQILRVDIQAVYDRDPACDRFMEPVLYFKGLPIGCGRKGGEILRSTCKAVPPRFSRLISTRKFRWDRGCSLTTPPV